ncbi:MAG: peptidoglycan-binding domain-containing protein [Minisyncoccia bacterium]
MGKKLTASILTGIFALSMAVSPVFGQSVQELQAQIQQLLGIIAQLQQQIAALQGGQQTTGTYCFNTDLYYGLTSNDVKNLQIILGVTPTSGYFGPLTKAAVQRFQAQYGIPQTGYVGPLTRAKLNELYCTPVTTTTTSAGTTTTTVVAPAYGTLSITSYPVSNAQTTLYGGQTYELVAAQFKATGSDITVKKIAVTIDHTAADAFPWGAFSKLSLYDGSNLLAEIVPSSANAIENTFADNYTFNFTGLNWVVPNNSTKVLTVKGTVVTNPVSDVQDDTWGATIEYDQLVFTDTAGINYSVASGSDVSRTGLTITTTLSADVNVSLATDNPKAQNIIVSTSGATRVEIMRFNVEVKDLDVTFSSGSVTITKGVGLATSDVISAELWDGSTLLASAAPSWSGNDGSVSWSNFSLPVAAGTTKTLSIKVNIAAQSSSFAGGSTKYVVISTTGPSLTGIDTNSNVKTADGTSLDSERFYPFLKAPVFALSNASLTASGSTSSTVADLGTAKIVFTVTANGGDIYIPTSDNSTTSITKAIYKNGSSVTPSTSSASWTCSNATEDSTNKFWRITSGSTATCEFNATFKLTGSSDAGYYEVRLASIGWNTSATSTGAVSQTWGIDTLKTGQTYFTGQ